MDQCASQGCIDMLIALLSIKTAPLSSLRMKSENEKKYFAEGQQWVWIGTISPGMILVSKTRSVSFSKSRRWYSGAAMAASSSGSQLFSRAQRHHRADAELGCQAAAASAKGAGLEPNLPETHSQDPLVERYARDARKVPEVELFAGEGRMGIDACMGREKSGP